MLSIVFGILLVISVLAVGVGVLMQLIGRR